MSLSPKNAALLKPACEAKIVELLNQAYELCQLIGSSEALNQALDNLPEIEDTQTNFEGASSELERALDLTDEDLDSETVNDSNVRDINLVTRQTLPPIPTKRRIKKGPPPGTRFGRSGKPESKFRGVSWQEGSQCWRVRLNYKGRNKDIGKFNDEVVAAKAYDKWKYKATGKTKSLNFPENYA